MVIRIKDIGNVETCQKHYDYVENFVINHCNGKAKVKPNLGFATGHISLICNDYFFIGVLLQKFSDEIVELVTI